MTEAMPFLRKNDITFLRPPAIPAGILFPRALRPGSLPNFPLIWEKVHSYPPQKCLKAVYRRRAIRPAPVGKREGETIPMLRV